MEKQFYLVTEVGAFIGYHKTKVYELIKEGRLEAIELDGIIRVTPDAIEKFVRTTVESSTKESPQRKARRERAQAAGLAAKRGGRASDGKPTGRLTR